MLEVEHYARSYEQACKTGYPTLGCGLVIGLQP